MPREELPGLLVEISNSRPGIREPHRPTILSSFNGPHVSVIRPPLPLAGPIVYDLSNNYCNRLRIECLSYSSWFPPSNGSAWF